MVTETVVREKKSIQPHGEQEVALNTLRYLIIYDIVSVVSVYAPEG
jgi:hypothetical protein